MTMHKAIDDLDDFEVGLVREAWIDLMLTTPECEHTVQELTKVKINDDGTEKQWWCVVGLLNRIDYRALLGVQLMAIGDEWEYHMANRALGHKLATERMYGDNDGNGEGECLTFLELAERTKSGEYDWIAQAGQVHDTYRLYDDFVDGGFLL